MKNLAIKQWNRKQTKITERGERVADFYSIASQIEEAVCDMNFLDQDMDTSTPAGKLLFNILGSLIDFDRKSPKARSSKG